MYTDVFVYFKISFTRLHKNILNTAGRYLFCFEGKAGVGEMKRVESLVEIYGQASWKRKL